MKVKVKYWESNLDLDLVWQCSNCGTLNLSKQTITETTSYYHNNALDENKKRINKIMTELGHTNVSQRYDHAGFKCACDRCYHKEAWARTYGQVFACLFAGLAIFLGLFGFVAIIAFSSFWNALMRGDAAGIILFSGILALSAILLIVYLAKKQHLNVLHKKIAQLPPSAIPRIYKHNPNRHTHFFYKRNKIKTAEDLEEYVNSPYPLSSV